MNNEKKSHHSPQEIIGLSLSLLGLIMLTGSLVDIALVHKLSALDPAIGMYGFAFLLSGGLVATS